ncbi:MAG: molybdopterin-binding protein [Bacillota bacterium]|nr:molybdopterin-binding protein [Bacillota bacterium]
MDAARLLRVNLADGLLVATRHDNSPVKEGEVVARAKVRGLVVREEVLREAEGIAAGHPVLSVLRYCKVRAGAVIAGREVYDGRVKDAFGPLLRSRLEEYGSTVAHIEIVPDEVVEVARALTSMLGKGVDTVLVTGGMSPDDSTVEGIRRSGAEVVFHGVAVSPGAMSVLAYAGEVPVVGIPAGLLARPRGFLDLVLPRLLAGERLGREDAAWPFRGG